MKIVFLCLGSRGDVQPYVALGKTAKLKGHSVCVCTGQSFQTFVEENGLDFYECGLDLMALLRTKEGKIIFEEGLKHPLKAIKYAKEVINPMYRKAMREFYVACKEADVIVFHPKAFGAVDIAQKLGILCISMPPIPIIYPIKAFPNLAITTKNLGSIINRLTYQLANLGAESNNIKDINDFRVNDLKLKKRKAGAYMIKREQYPLPIFYLVSQRLFSEIEEFKDKVTLTGFPILETTQTLDSETQEFLKDNKAPIIITFSSMPLSKPQEFLDKIVRALKSSNNRGIILVGNSGIVMDSEESILVKESMPHDIVFKYAKGIVHHGGVGTMASALRSGKPQVIMPFHVDQPFWAKRLYHLGFSLEPIKEKDDESEFVKRFIAMEDSFVIHNAKEIARSINLENPNEFAIQCIEQQYEEWNKQR